MKLPWLALVLPAVLLAVTQVRSKAGGIYHNSITRSAPSCGQCHRSSPGAPAGFPAVRADLAPAARSLTGGQSISVTLTALGGQSGSRGGFAADASAGRFTAGSGTNLHANGSAITHDSPASRKWTFGYTAPATPGLVNLFAVVNTVNGNFKKDSGDFWAFHGADQTARTATPVRLFVNAQGITPFGRSCVGSFGNVPVLGAARAPRVGEQAFAVELHGAAPSSPVALLVGANPNFKPIDLGPIGIAGCTLYVDVAATVTATTGAGNAQRGEGSARFPMPIPNNPWLRTVELQVQAAIVDLRNGRRVPVTATNGLRVRFL